MLCAEFFINSAFRLLGFEGLSSLRHLLLSHNLIFQLPPGLYQLDQLETLDIYSNKITIIQQVGPAGDP